MDFEKAFDFVKIWAVPESLRLLQIDYRHIAVPNCLYGKATMLVLVQEQISKAILLKRGVRKGDVMSSKLLTAALEDAFKLLEWTGLGININGEYIIQLRFADDIVAR